MDDYPSVSDWIVPAICFVLLASVLNILPLIAPTTPAWSVLNSSAYLCVSGLLALCAFVALARLIRWWVWVRNTELQRAHEARAITPLRRAMEAAARLTEEQAALVHIYMPHETGDFVYLEQAGDLELYFEWDGVKVPFTFIEEFLIVADNVKLMAVSSTSDKTPRRAYVQTLTSYCIHRKWAVPHNGDMPAMWREGGREKASLFWHIQLRNGVGYVEPEGE